jgi:hypothetical protein
MKSTEATTTTQEQINEMESEGQATKPGQPPAAAPSPRSDRDAKKGAKEDDIPQGAPVDQSQG